MFCDSGFYVNLLFCQIACFVDCGSNGSLRCRASAVLLGSAPLMCCPLPHSPSTFSSVQAGENEDRGKRRGPSGWSSLFLTAGGGVGDGRQRSTHICSIGKGPLLISVGEGWKSECYPLTIPGGVLTGVQG